VKRDAQTTEVGKLALQMRKTQVFIEYAQEVLSKATPAATKPIPAPTPSSTKMFRVVRETKVDAAVPGLDKVP
jgi:hypothetical protein